MKPITPTQADILLYYQLYCARFLSPPTIQIVAYFMETSRSTAYEHILNLVKRGDLVRTGNHSRNYKPKEK